MKSRLASQLSASIIAQHLQTDILLCISYSCLALREGCLGRRRDREQQILEWNFGWAQEKKKSHLLAKLKNEVETPGSGYWKESSSPLDGSEGKGGRQLYCGSVVFPFPTPVLGWGWIALLSASCKDNCCCAMPVAWLPASSNLHVMYGEAIMSFHCTDLARDHIQKPAMQFLALTLQH